MIQNVVFFLYKLRQGPMSMSGDLIVCLFLGRLNFLKMRTSQLFLAENSIEQQESQRLF